MSSPTLTQDGDVHVLDLGDDENRLNPAWVDAVAGHLASVEAAEGPKALVTTARGKFFSNGLDLEWMGAHADEVAGFLPRVHGLFSAFLTAGVPTVAAIQGHCFAAGAMLAVAHDQRVMRADRGFLCLPEVHIRIPFTPGMTALLATKLDPVTAHEAMTTGRRYGGEDARAARIVDEAVAEDEVLPRALERARALAGGRAGAGGETAHRAGPGRRGADAAGRAGVR